ncbi:MAG: hypothetical protein QOF56_3151 [Acidobacteriaceae bacterium]|nr:hypothetical protein [Acidobacteriaceae bacterium]
MERQNQPAASAGRGMADSRRQPRFKLEVNMSISSRNCGVLKGHTVDLSDSGISAILRIEVPVDEMVELEFILPLGPVRVYAVVRQRNAFRYGFQFVQSVSAEEVIQATYRRLVIEQTLLGRSDAVLGVRGRGARVYFSSVSFWVAICTASGPGLSFLICS